MCDSESQFKSEPNAFEGESSDSLFDSNSEAVSLDAEGGEDTDVEILGEVPSSVPTPFLMVALMGVVTAFGMAEEGEPSYEQFSYLYSITKSKSADHGGWVQANYLRASERGHFVSTVQTSQKSRRNRRVLLSGKLKHLSPTKSEIQQIDKVRLKVPAVERIYPKFLFTENLVRARLVNPAEMTNARKAAEAKKMNESSKRRLMMGLQEKKKNRQSEVPLVHTADADPKEQTLAERLRRLNDELAQKKTAGDSASKAARKRPFTVDLDVELVLKRGRQSDVPKAIFSIEDDEGPVEPINIACPSKTVQFANHMIIGSQMELSEIEALPKKILREEAGCAFRLQASSSMDMWLYMKRAITAA
ncbi:unnamed protein product [Prunus armeniaca]